MFQDADGHGMWSQETRTKKNQGVGHSMAVRVRRRSQIKPNSSSKPSHTLSLLSSEILETVKQLASSFSFFLQLTLSTAVGLFPPHKSVHFALLSSTHLKLIADSRLGWGAKRAAARGRVALVNIAGSLILTFRVSTGHPGLL